MLLLNFVLLLEVFYQVLGIRIIQPYGPKMCTELCQEKKDCSLNLFNSIDLSCKLISKTPNFNQHTITHDTDKEAVVTMRNVEQRKMKSGKPCSLKNRGRLQKACNRKDLPEFERLFSSGLMGINCRDKRGRTPIMYTAKYNFIAGFDFLVQKNCDLRVRDNNKMCVLHWATSKNIVKILLDEHHADIDCRDGMGETALMLGVHRGRLQVVKMLYENGANMFTVDLDNNTVLHRACMRKKVGMVKYILSLKIIDIESRGKNGRTPLLSAVDKGSIKVAKFLLQHKAKVAALNDDKDNVLHIACRNDDLATVKFLFTLKKVRGFKMRKNRLGITPADLAFTRDIKLLFHN